MSRAPIPGAGSRGRWLAIAVAGLLAGGCKASLAGSASASVDADAMATDEAIAAEGRASIDAAAGGGSGVRVSERLRYLDGKLDYEGTVNFKTDSAELDGAETYEILGDLRDVLRTHPDVEVAIEGHTDSRASASYNRALSHRRADSVAEWLTAEGVDTLRLAAAGLGEDDPQVPEPPECLDAPAKRRDDPDCEASYWRHNRRVVFRVTAGGETLTAVPPEAVAETPVPGVKKPAEDDRPRLRPGGFLYGGPGLAVFSRNYLNTLDLVDGTLDSSSFGLVKFQMFAGGGYLWLPTKRFMVAATVDIETSPLGRPRGVYGWSTRIGPTLRVGAHGRRWMSYVRLTPGLQLDRERPAFTIAPDVGAIGLITRHFAMGVEIGPDFDTNFTYTHADAKLMFVWFFGGRR